MKAFKSLSLALLIAISSFTMVPNKAHAIFGVATGEVFGIIAGIGLLGVSGITSGPSVAYNPYFGYVYTYNNNVSNIFCALGVIVLNTKDGSVELQAPTAVKAAELGISSNELAALETELPRINALVGDAVAKRNASGASIAAAHAELNQAVAEGVSAEANAAYQKIASTMRAEATKATN